MNTNPHGDVVPVRPIQVRLARLGLFAVLILLIVAQFTLFDGSAVTVETQHDSTIYRSESSSGYFLFALAGVTTVLAIVYVLQPGIFRWFGAALFLITGWLGYTAFTMNTSNHSVRVSPTGVVREVGTTREPIRHEIEFTQTDYLFIDEVKDNSGSRYELVAYETRDGAETRIPIYDMMRAALPQILETATRHNLVIGESENGEVIPAGLRAKMK